MHIKEIVEMLHRKTKGSVFLDIGTGMGNVLKFAKEHFLHCIGLDVSEKMLMICRRRGFWG